jgi:[ribosomal protein S18]-alanine N-acetyltransferase
MAIATTPRHVPVTLRPMRRGDLDAVLAIEQRAFPQPWSRGFFEKELAAPQARCTVAVRDDDAALVGYTVVWRVLDEVHLLNVAVHDGHRGAAVGRRLLDHVLADGRATGARVVYLEVRAGNVPARRLYRRLGFRDLGVRRAYYGPGQDAIVMELRLAAAR